MRRLGIVGLLSLVLGGSCIIFFTKKNVTIFTELNKLTTEERYYLEGFFKSCAFEDLSYVLFGHKPMAYMCFVKPESFHAHYKHLSFSDMKTKKGLAIFRKYQPFFSKRKFIMYIDDSEPDTVAITLVNKKNFICTFNKYRQDIEKILGEKLTGEDILFQMAQEDHFALPFTSDALLGILFGYGNHNSQLVQRRTEICDQLEKTYLLKKYVLLHRERENIDQRMQHFVSFQEKYSSIIKKPFMGLPKFNADRDDPETKELIELYTRDQKKIKQIYSQPNFLEIVFKRLCN